MAPKLADARKPVRTARVVRPRLDPAALKSIRRALSLRFEFVAPNMPVAESGSTPSPRKLPDERDYEMPSLDLMGQIIARSPDRKKILGHGPTVEAARAAAGGRDDVVFEIVHHIRKFTPRPDLVDANGKWTGGG